MTNGHGPGASQGVAGGSANIPLTLDPPRTRDAIVQELRRLHGETTAYWTGFSTAAFLTPLGPSWSPADTVRHLTKSLRGVTRGLTLPRIALWLAFGPARHRSRDYDQIRTTYLGVLASGGQAGRYAPRPQPDIPRPDVWRATIMERHEIAAAALQRAVERWSETALDRYQLPHPLLGKLTVREMLLFTLYHNVHHIHVVARRLSASPADRGADSASPIP